MGGVAEAPLAPLLLGGLPHVRGAVPVPGAPAHADAGGADPQASGTGKSRVAVG